MIVWLLSMNFIKNFIAFIYWNFGLLNFHKSFINIVCKHKYAYMYLCISME